MTTGNSNSQDDPRPSSPQSSSAPLDYEWSRDSDGRVRLNLCGRLDVETTGQVWRDLESRVGPSVPAASVDASELAYCDGAGVAFLLELESRVDGQVEFNGLSESIRQMVDSFDADTICRDPAEQTSTRVVEGIGRYTASIGRDLLDLTIYIGHVLTVLARVARSPRKLRWGDTLLTAERAGYDAVGIVSLVGFLMGLIMAFQSAIPMRQFNVEIFVADLVGISMVRELGPLMAAVVLAGRSGSAFAAEIGTMKVNEEVDALKTMGLDPVQFLVAPRIVAVVMVTPILSLVCGLAGLFGGLVVMLSLGFTPVVYLERLEQAISLTSFVSGTSKSFAFGLLVAGIGCARGLRTGRGPTAVGESATLSVVSGIVLIAIADAVFAVLFFAFDI